MTDVAGTRAAALKNTAHPFDLIVVGGGINGCGIAWDAALRGLRVLLVEKEDFGWATSAWNSRLIHGGLKYLEKYDVQLVRESLREREWLLHAAPHLVRPLRFLLPFYQRNAHPAWMLRLGLLAYDVLSWDKSTPRHRVLDRGQLTSLIPGLDDDGLQGGGAYYDAQVNYAERLSLEVALAAQAAGAVVLNHAQADRMITSSGAVTGVSFTDTTTGRSYEARSTTVVNAAGPWVDEVLAPSSARERSPLMGGTKGTHLVVDPFPGAPVDCAMYYEAMTDARPMMVIPWLGRYILGATDVRFQGDLDRASVDADELDYILRETNLVLPSAHLTADDVLWRYTGVRPLPHQESGPTGDITRRHIVHDHGRDRSEPVSGLYSVIGGKLTTFRSLAQQVNDTVLRQRVDGRRERGRRATSTLHSRLPGARAVDVEGFARGFRASTILPPDVADRVLRLYGTRAVHVEALATAEPGLACRVDGVPGLVAAEIALALRAESALTLADVVARRVMTGIGKDLGMGSLDAVAQVVAAQAGWSDSRTADEVAGYLAYTEKLGPGPPGRVGDRRRFPSGGDAA
jgi:glycerol-3-phosphate dehydrogenase